MGLVLVSERHGRKVYMDEADLAKRVHRQGQAPAFLGRQKPGSVSREVRVLRPRGFEDTECQLKAIEDAGKMTPEMARMGKDILKDLKDKKDGGLQADVDFWTEGHPMEREPESVPVISEDS